MDLIFFALITGFIIYKLFTLLGSDNEENINRAKNKQNSIFDIEDDEDNVDIIDVTPNKARANQNIVYETEKPLFNTNLDDSAKNVINAVNMQDQNFNEERFVKGAKIAFEQVLKAFSSGNKDKLKSLLAPDLCKSFENQLMNLAARGERKEKTLVGINSVEIISGEIKNNIASLKLKFVSEQIQLTKNEASGAIMSGDASKIDVVEDIWVFVKDLSDQAPNWYIKSV